MKRNFRRYGASFNALSPTVFININRYHHWVWDFTHFNHAHPSAKPVVPDPRFFAFSKVREKMKKIFRKWNFTFAIVRRSEFGTLSNATVQHLNATEKKKNNRQLLWIASHFFAFHLSSVDCPRRWYNWSAWCSLFTVHHGIPLVRPDHRFIFFYQIIIIISKIRSERTSERQDKQKIRLIEMRTVSKLHFGKNHALFEMNEAGERNQKPGIRNAVCSQSCVDNHKKGMFVINGEKSLVNIFWRWNLRAQIAIASHKIRQVCRRVYLNI